MPFIFKKLWIKDVILIKPTVFEDKRGFFTETYVEPDFVRAGIKEKFVQENHSKSKRGVFRGFHYQKNPMAQAKLVRCISGKVLDIVVDIRRNSSTYGEYLSKILSEYNKQMIYIPHGFAHGFLSLENDSEIVYKSSEVYSPKDERGIIYNDSDLNINFSGIKIIVSDKDSNLPTLKKADNNFI